MHSSELGTVFCYFCSPLGEVFFVRPALRAHFWCAAVSREDATKCGKMHQMKQKQKKVTFFGRKLKTAGCNRMYLLVCHMFYRLPRKLCMEDSAPLRVSGSSNINYVRTSIVFFSARSHEHVCTFTRHQGPGTTASSSIKVDVH